MGDIVVPTIVKPGELPAGFKAEDLGKFRLAVPEKNYHSDKTAVSQGALTWMEYSPAHFIHNWQQPYTEGGASDVMKTGTLLHMALLEPHRWREKQVLPKFGDRRFKEAKAEYAAWLEAQPDAWVTLNDKGERNGIKDTAPYISAEEKARVEAMAESVLSKRDLAALLKDALTEATVYWVDEETRILQRARLDIVSPAGIIGDLKTCEDARAVTFSKSIHNNSYDFQGGHYMAGANSTGGGYSDFVFGAVERNPPYKAWGHVLVPRALERGKARRADALLRLRDCITTNTWPDYPDQLTPIDLPQYAYQVGG